MIRMRIVMVMMIIIIMIMIMAMMIIMRMMIVMRMMSLDNNQAATVTRDRGRTLLQKNNLKL